jgi:hypothetical protein
VVSCSKGYWAGQGREKDVGNSRGSRFAYYRKESLMGNVKKWRKKKIAKHKHRKRRKRDRWQHRKRK